MAGSCNICTKKSKDARWADGTNEEREKYCINIIVVDYHDPSETPDNKGWEPPVLGGTERSTKSGRPLESAVPPVARGPKQTKGIRVTKRASAKLPAVHPLAGTSRETKVDMNPMADQGVQRRGNPRLPDFPLPLREIDYPLRYPRSPRFPRHTKAPRCSNLQRGRPRRDSLPMSSCEVRPTCTCVSSRGPNGAAGTDTGESTPAKKRTVLHVVVFIILVGIVLVIFLWAETEAEV